MQIKPIESENNWNPFFIDCGSPSFLQSWEWGNLQEALGYRTERIGLYEKDKLTAAAQIIKIKARRGNMLFVPHGPLLADETPSRAEPVLRTLLGYLKETAKREDYSFIRIAPGMKDTPENRKLYSALGMRTSPIYMHAERLWVVDISKPEEDLLKEMRKTTRYSIRRAAKDGAVIETRTDPGALDDFWGIYKETAARENFTPFSKSFIKHEFEAFFRSDSAVYLLGKIKDAETGKERYEAGALIVFTKSTGFYHQGASLHSKIPVAYLMQWEAIREAKKRGCTLYNFWGILQPGRTPKNWGGLSLFKQGFGGHQVDYVPTQDYVINPVRYGLSYLYEQYLKAKRGV